MVQICNVQSVWERVFFLIKLTILLPYGLSSVFLDIYPREMKTPAHTHTKLFTVISFLMFTTGNNQENGACVVHLDQSVIQEHKGVDC